MKIRSAAFLALLTALTACSSQDPNQDTPSAMSHALQGMESCLTCHAVGVMAEVPDVTASHAGRGNETCLWCHAPDAVVQTVESSPIPHPLEGMAQCLLCHTAGAMQGVPSVPADHAGRPNESCVWCHTPAEP